MGARTKPSLAPKNPPSAKSSLATNAKICHPTAKTLPQSSLKVTASSSTTSNLTAKTAAISKAKTTGTSKPTNSVAKALHRQQEKKIDASSSKHEEGMKAVQPKVVQVSLNSKIQ
ncbi:hypothetical protein MMC18_009653, partial [Xylographa bjoerkii]|nr:hypothetical protein [Xylographa bjoerkii]